MTVVAGFDADPSCKYAFEQNNGAPFVCKPIETTSAKEVLGWFPEGSTRVLVGCAPCQPFSSYSSSSKRRKDWTLLEQFADLVDAAQPDVVSMENVTRLRSFDRGALFDYFVDRLERHYKVSFFHVPCTHYGVPQTRVRLVLFASVFGPVNLEPPSLEGKAPTVRTAIGHLPPIRHGEVHHEDPLHRSQSLSDLNLRRIRASRPGGTWSDWPDELRAACHRRETGRTYRNVYGRMEWERPSPTITTGCFNYGRGRFGHPDQDRAISLREAALLQTFPEDYEFAEEAQKIYFDRVGRQIGNAVPVALGEAIGQSICAHLKDRGVL